MDQRFCESLICTNEFSFGLKTCRTFTSLFWKKTLFTTSQKLLQVPKSSNVLGFWCPLLKELFPYEHRVGVWLICLPSVPTMLEIPMLRVTKKRSGCKCFTSSFWSLASGMHLLLRHEELKTVYIVVATTTYMYNGWSFTCERMHVHVLQRHVHRLKVCVPTCVGTPIDHNFPSYLSNFPKPILKMSYQPLPSIYISLSMLVFFVHLLQCSSWNLGGFSTQIVDSNPPGRSSYGNPLVSFERHLRSQSVFLVWSRTTSRCFEVWSLFCINYTGEFRVHGPPSFLIEVQQSCPTQKSTCVKQIVG